MDGGELKGSGCLIVELPKTLWQAFDSEFFFIAWILMRHKNKSYWEKGCSGFIFVFERNGKCVQIKACGLFCLSRKKLAHGT